MREPLEDPGVTHGLCSEHATALVQERPDSQLCIGKIQVGIWQLEQQLRQLQTEPEAPWAQALRAQLDSVLRDLTFTLAERSLPSREGRIAGLRAWIIPMRSHTQIINHTLQRVRRCIQTAQHRIERGHVLLRAKSHGRESAAAHAWGAASRCANEAVRPSAARRLPSMYNGVEACATRQCPLSLCKPMAERNQRVGVSPFVLVPLICCRLVP
ncbi:MAG TPA: hypothetical protein VNP04_08750 [Alphaproteobacteria bacterium]|nr:hypothetical protein [Alphaproteobacteria bacterium]